MTKDWASSSPGAVRRVNEDNLLSRPDLGLWVVADGAGGHAAGAMASAMIVEHLNRLAGDFSLLELAGLVREKLLDVHAQLRANAKARGNEIVIASTVAALILKSDQYACLWVGDSRLYLLRRGKLRQISKDHSLVQELIDLGKLSPPDAERHPHANVITRALGADQDELEIDQVSGTAAPGDRFLLCSDGVSKTLTLAEMRGLLSAEKSTPPPQRLIDAALARNVRDNVTAIVVEIPPAQPGR